MTESIPQSILTWAFTNTNIYCFGIASVPAIFQNQMEKNLQGVPKAVCYLHDGLIQGKDDSKHLATLEKVFD